MTITNEPTMPIPLAQYLDEGGDPRREDVGDLYDTFGDAMVNVLTVAPSRLAEMAHWARVNAQEVVDDEHYTSAPSNASPREMVRLRGWLPTEPDLGWTSHQEYVTHEAWTADIYDGGAEMVERLVGLMTPDERARWDGLVEEVERPYPLVVVAAADQTSWWSCCGCGKAHEAGEALFVEVDGVRDEPRYCFACIERAYEACILAGLGDLTR